MRAWWTKLVLLLVLSLGLVACGGDDGAGDDVVAATDTAGADSFDADGTGTDTVADVPHAWTAMTGATADCEFPIVTFTVAGGEPVEVSLNGLPVADVKGADKIEGTTWEVVTRRGVRFTDILAKAGLSEPDTTPVNGVARDGFDPLRTKLAGDQSKLPTLAFLRDKGYVYVGGGGDKDPLYPEMEGRSLLVDYDLAGDADVPAELGGLLSSLGQFRWKMIEKLDEQTRGVIELAPVVE